LVFLAFLWRVDYHVWARIDDLLLLGVFLATILTLFPGLAHGQRWLQLGPLGKLALVLYVSSSLVRRGERINSFKEGVAPYLVVFGAFGVVLALQPDFGMFVLYGALIAFLLLVGGVPLRPLLGTAAAMLLAPPRPCSPLGG